MASTGARATGLPTCSRTSSLKLARGATRQDPSAGSASPKVIIAMTLPSMEGGSVDELLDVTVERLTVDQLEVEVGRTLEDRVGPGLTGDDREDRDLHEVDEAGGH